MGGPLGEKKKELSFFFYLMGCALDCIRISGKSEPDRGKLPAEWSGIDFPVPGLTTETDRGKRKLRDSAYLRNAAE